MGNRSPSHQGLPSQASATSGDEVQREAAWKPPRQLQPSPYRHGAETPGPGKTQSHRMRQKRERRPETEDRDTERKGNVESE